MKETAEKENSGGKRRGRKDKEGEKDPMEKKNSRGGT
jgi:hypothetical protein